MSFEAEQAVLGSMMLDNECICLIADMLTQDMFTDPIHQKIFIDIIALNDSGMPVDLLTVKKKGNPVEVVVKIGESVPHAVSAEYYARMVVESFTLNKYRMFGKKIEQICNSPVDHNNKLSEIETEYREIDTKEETGISHIRDINFSFEESTEEHLATQFKGLNDIIIGFKKTDMIVIGGRPGMGKTSLMLDFAIHYGMSNKIPVAIFSLEMTAEQLKQMVVCTWCEVPLKSAKQGYATTTQMELIYESEKQFNSSEIFIEKAAGLTPSKLKHKLAKCKRLYGTKVAFVDYLQIMRSDIRGSNYEMKTDISRSIKEIAVDLEIPIVIGSQLNRSVDSRDDKHPRLSDFRDTGAIEEDADLIMTLYRPSWYTKDFSEETELEILKGREFGTGKIDLKFNANITHFREDISQMEFFGKESDHVEQF